MIHILNTQLVHSLGARGYPHNGAATAFCPAPLDLSERQANSFNQNSKRKSLRQESALSTLNPWLSTTAFQWRGVVP